MAFLRSAAALAVACLVSGPVTDAQPGPVGEQMSADAVRAAVHAGVATNVTPLRLQPHLVFLHPLTRVALAAQRAYREQPGSFDEAAFAAQLPPWVTSSLIWVVFEVPCQDANTGCGAVLAQPDGLSPGPPEVAADWHVTMAATPQRVRPVQVTSNLSFLDALGPLDVREPAIVAAFAPGTIHPGQQLFALWPVLERDRLVVAGQVTEAHLAGPRFR